MNSHYDPGSSMLFILTIINIIIFVNKVQNQTFYKIQPYYCSWLRKLQIKKKCSRTGTFHDPYYLDRYTGEYDAPRNLIRRLGFDLINIPCYKENSFCCGAGGGMIWKEEVPHDDRPAMNRMREAEAVNASKFIVSCPKDKVMFVDAGKDFEMEVVDIVSLLYDALDIPEPVKEVAPSE